MSITVWISIYSLLLIQIVIFYKEKSASEAKMPSLEIRQFTLMEQKPHYAKNGSWQFFVAAILKYILILFLSV